MKYFHAHKIALDRCDGRRKCLRACPTQAIRIRNEKARIINELCIDCGECLHVCPNSAFEPISDPLTDLNRYKVKIAIPSPSLYSQFGPDVYPLIIHEGLKKMGFDEVVDISPIGAEVGIALAHHLKTDTTYRPLISSLCPVVVRFIQVWYPELTEYIVPIEVPRELTARHVKTTYPEKFKVKSEDIGVVYISPCSAKIVSIKQPAEKAVSWFDSAITIKDVYNKIMPDVIKMQKMSTGKSDLKLLPRESSWTLTMDVIKMLGSDRWLSVTGIPDIKKVFDDIVNSRIRSIDFVEAFACMNGCVGGVFNVENPYVARSNLIKSRNKFYEQHSQLNEEEIIRKCEEGYYKLENPVVPRPLGIYGSDMSISIKRIKQKERVLKKLPKIDCTCCGAPTCSAFAEDFVRGEVDLLDCIHLSRKHYERE